MNKITAAFLYTVFAGALFAVDRIAKLWAIDTLFTEYNVFPGLSFDLAYNRGVSWSMLAFDNHFLFMLVTFMNIALTIWIAHIGWGRWQQRRCVAGELMVITGALSNIIDRFVYGGVVDFIDIYIGHWHWPTFNIADIAIVLGVGLMIGFHVRES